VSVHRPPRSRHPTSIAQFHWQGGLLPEDALPGWDDPGSVRTRGFHCAISSPGTEAEGQPHPLPRRACPKSPLAWAGHTSQARQRHPVHLQHRIPHTCRTSCRNDLGTAAKARFQHRHRGLQSLWRICQSHRLYRGPGRHRSNTDSPAPERTGNTDSAIAGATDQSATWDIASFRWEGFQHNSTTPARKPVKTAWHELLRALVQE
jgi:hypothetical protein